MLHKKLKPFPSDFLWGASTSAYQVEIGRASCRERVSSPV